jgi:transposase InsO family protein
MDRLLKSERKKYGKRKSTTRPGHLLKRQIAVRTHSDWNEARPGFLEIDLVAHGGETASGQFLNTLTITDIASTWTECFGLISKSEVAVVEALTTAQGQLPFQILGIDSDNGSEFINHGLLDWCKKNQVTFTRSREYKKNDQAHVEERNGSIVRRLIGYDRYEGEASCCSLQAIYERSRLLEQLLSTSMKLASKSREGGKINRTYGTAYSPYERLLQNAHVTDVTKEILTEQFKALDPVVLLKHIEVLQERFWNSAINLSRQTRAQPATTKQQLTAA